jgi:hypothetical protein
MAAFTDRYFLPLTTRNSVSSGFGGVPGPEYRVIVDDKTLQRSAGDTFGCRWLSRGVDKYCSRWLVLGSSRGILSSCKGYGSRLGRIVDVSFAPSAYIMGVSQDVIIDTDVVKAGVAKKEGVEDRVQEGKYYSHAAYDQV